MFCFRKKVFFFLIFCEKNENKKFRCMNNKSLICKKLFSTNKEFVISRKFSHTQPLKSSWPDSNISFQKNMKIRKLFKDSYFLFSTKDMINKLIKDKKIINYKFFKLPCSFVFKIECLSFLIVEKTSQVSKIPI